MKEYEARMYDVVAILNINDSESFKLLELEEKEEYMVNYVFADGSCVLYKEKLLKNKQLEVYEYVVEEDDVKYLSPLCNYMDEENFNDEYDYGDIMLLDNNFSKYEWTEHEFEVGDYVYFENVRVIKLHREAELQNKALYRISSINEMNNCPMIETNIGEFELYPNEVYYLKLYEGDIYDDVKENLDTILEEISNEVSQHNYEVAMDIALSENDIAKAQEIYKLHNKIK